MFSFGGPCSESRAITLPVWDKGDRLKNRKQWKTWYRRVELDLKGLKLFDCILAPNGKDNWDEETRTKKLALAQSYLNGAVCKSIGGSLINSPSPYESFLQIQAQYGPNETYGNTDLWRKIKNIKFVLGHNQQRYVSDFRTMLTDMLISPECRSLNL